MAIVDINLPIVPISADDFVPLGPDGLLVTVNGSQTGGPLTDVLVGTTGNDVLNGAGGSDILTGTLGNDA